MWEVEHSLGSLWGTRSARALTLARLGGLGAILWATAHRAEPHLSGRAWAVPALMALAVIGWLGWMASRRFGAPPRVTWACLALLSVAGGVLAGYSPFAVALVAVACLGAGVAFEAGPAIVIGAVGFGSVVISALALGGPVPGEVIAEGALAAIAGLLTGASRRQYQARAHEAEQLLAERAAPMPSATGRRPWLSATVSGARSTTCWPTPWGLCRSSSRRPTLSWRPVKTRTKRVAW